MRVVAVLLLSFTTLFAVGAFKAPAASRFTAGTRNSALRMSSANTNDVPSNARQNIQKLSQEVLRSSVIAGSAFLGASRIANADDAKPAPVPDKDGFVTTESGLKYRDTTVGTGATPIPGDTVRVHYTGWLDGFESDKKFDSSYDRRSPLTFKAGVKQVIAGWDEALLTDLKVGGKRDIIVPSELGYGKRGAGGVIPPNATLYFKIELVGIGAR